MKKSIFFAFIISISFILTAFEWPVEEITTDSYGLYFAQNRGDLFSTSQIFAQPSEVHASEEGVVLVVITELEEDNDFFPSTLGSAVIVNHQDELLTVYANLDSESIAVSNKGIQNVEAGQLLAQSGDTGWQHGKSNLEFQIIDKKNNTAINPKILMPRIESEIQLSLGGIVIQNKSGEQFELANHKNFQAGVHKIYCKRNDVAYPFKTSVAVNGVVLDEIFYDTIIQENSKLLVTGKRKYTSNDIFPSEKLQLLGEVMFTSGKATLTLIIEDNLENRRQVNYNITVY